MPQMSPMLWFFIYLYVIMIFMFMIIMINYMINLYKLIMPSMKLINKIKLKWYW